MDAVDFLKEKAADLISISESTLEDVAKNPEKLRALLNLWFVPQFKPTFVPDRKKGAFDFELMGPSIEQPVCAPRRMFDIKTMNLVENVDIDEASQYCVLSHSWKGLEVDYPYVLRARDRDRTMARAEKTARRDDVTSIKNQCKADIEEKEKETQDSLDEAANQALSSIGLNGSDELIVEKLLSKRISSALVLREFENACKQLDAAKSKLAHAERESAVFKSLAQEMDATVSSGPPKETSIVEQDSGTKQSAVSQKATDVEEAQKILNKAEEAWKATKADREFFEDHSLVREAVDEMSGLLQRWRSAKKIEYSIKRAQEIFNDKSFPPVAKRYIWLDTCCINKTNQGELVDSLSLMGDWYSNAEFCLVHLDTSRSDTEWIEEWHRFKSDTLPEPNITDFDSIREACPEWSTRGWTLQELVLSKTTFYVNSAWKPLDRPVESLGPYYYLCPFIKLYTDKLYSKELPEEKLKQLRIIWKDMAGRAESDAQQNGADAQVLASQDLILLLQKLVVQLPKSLDMDTVIPLISHTVHIAAAGLLMEQKPEDGDRIILFHNLRARLQDYLSPNDEGRRESDETRVINFLLRCLVAEANTSIMKDRQYIADFGNIQGLKRWQNGTLRNKFSAYKVMSLACNRKCTVETDRAYSLMGLLAVRFPTFMAEGLPKALVRLFDEVIISSNDVSVFNWAGKELGSQIRGRSLYPSSLHAFHECQDEGESTSNKMLANRLHTKRNEVMTTFQRVVKMLREIINFVKGHKHEHLPMHWIQRIVEIVKAATFNELEPQLRDIGKILTFVQKVCGKKAIGDSETNPKSGNDIFSDAKKLLKPSLPRMHSDSMSEIAKAPIKNIMGFGSPFKGSFSKKRPADSNESPAAKRPKVKEESSPSPSLGSPNMLPDEAWKPLDRDVEAFLNSIEFLLQGKHGDSGGHEKEQPKLERRLTLPPDFDNITLEDEKLDNGKEDTRREEMESMISPNPIIVNNSGIEGVFDIQRVIITFQKEEHDRLQKHVDNAVSPHQKITGWCSISTGFAQVTVSFSCEKHILEKQLKVVQVVQKKVLDEQYKPPEGRVTKIWKQAVGLPGNSTLPERKDHDESQTVETEGKKGSHTRDEQKVVRMIEFIEEPQLEAVAGEWVLARFSDVPGANWFLCHLELGSTHDFYGHRIATDKIDFHDAMPEPGLLKVWQTYMSRKKRKLCYVLRDYLNSQVVGSAKESIWRRGLRPNDTAAEDEVDDDSDNFLNQALDLGITAVKHAGELTALTLFEEWFEFQAERLDKNLSAAVLKRTPKELQAAVENLNDNKDFLPAMFHSARRVHMF